MKVRQVHLNDDMMPETVLALFTIEEVAVLTAYLGRTTDTERDHAIARFGRVGSAIYDGFVDGVLNRYYDDGVREAYGSLP